MAAKARAVEAGAFVCLLVALKRGGSRLRGGSAFIDPGGELFWVPAIEGASRILRMGKSRSAGSVIP
jgi:hypothetical protein